MGVSRSAGRVARSRIVSAFAERRFASVRLSGSFVVMSVASTRPVRAGNQIRPVVQGRKVVPSAVPPSFGDAALVTDGPSTDVPSPTDRRCPVSLALCAGAYLWRSSPLRSVRRLPGPFTAVAAPVSTSHRVSLPTRDGYSSRSQPVIRDVAGSMSLARVRVKRGGVAADAEATEPEVLQRLHEGLDAALPAPAGKRLQGLRVVRVEGAVAMLTAVRLGPFADRKS